jgi:hypothetical protein
MNCDLRRDGKGLLIQLARRLGDLTSRISLSGVISEHDCGNSETDIRTRGLCGWN